MPTLFALLVGIDDYRALYPLDGSRNDVDRVRAFLEHRADPDRRTVIRTLIDEEATRDRIIGAFRDHLGQAVAGDSILFWFSGHGSTVPLPRDLWYREPSGFGQTLVCADSRVDGRPDLLDRELGFLISEAAARGAHSTVVLDCCHSASGTREAPSHRVDGLTAELIGLGAPVTVRWAEAGPMPRAADLLPLPPTAAAQGGADHVLLAACRNHEQAYETGSAGNRNGLFTLGLLDALTRLGARATYRELMTAARCYVENARPNQVPNLFPAESKLIDQPFLGGALCPQASPLVLRRIGRQWEVNAGRLIGLDPAGQGRIRVAVLGDGPLREARITEVLTERSLAEPIGWTPESDGPYRATLSHVPLPRTTVVVGGRPADDRAWTERITAGLEMSPYVRVVPIDDAAAADGLRVTTAGGEVRIATFHGPPLTRDLGPLGVSGVVDRLVHIVRWRTTRTLSNDYSGLAGRVRLEIVHAEPGVGVAPETGGRIAEAGADDLVTLDYTWRAGEWVAPEVFVRIRNLSDQRLYCVLLDLTDRFAVYPDLFSGDFVGAHKVGAAFDGQRVEFSLPGDRPIRPGAEVRDWLQLVVSAEEFDAEALRLPVLGEHTGARSRREATLHGVLDQWAATAMFRDGRRKTLRAYDWTTVLVPVLTRVPVHPNG